MGSVFLDFDKDTDNDTIGSVFLDFDKDTNNDTMGSVFLYLTKKLSMIQWVLHFFT